MGAAHTPRAVGAGVPREIAGIKVIDVDTHLTEPRDLWTKRAPKDWKERVPRSAVVDGKPVWLLDGKDFSRAGTACCVKADGSKQHGWSFTDLRFDEIHPAAHDAKARVQLMDEQGIHAQIVYPNLLGFGNTRAVNYDPELRLLCTRIYNDAMAELQQESGERLFPMALLPWWDVPAAVAEVRRAHAMGLRGVTTNCDPQEAGFPDLCSRIWDPLWEICDDLSLPVNFHIGSSETQGSWFGSTPWPSFGPDQKLAIGGAMMFFSNARTITNLIFSGVLERFPKLNFVSVESGIGWIPHLLDSLDYQIGELAPQTMSYLSLKPSEYFRRQIYSCYWFERNNLPEVIRQVGADNIMFETDFPHPVCLYPNGLDQASAALAGVSLEDQRKILSGNAARLYSIAV